MENTERIIVKLRTQLQRQEAAVAATKAHIALLEAALAEQLEMKPQSAKTKTLRA